MEFLLLACGCYWIIYGMVLNVNGKLLHKLFFKILPFFTGVATCLVAMNMMGWVSIW